MLQKQMLDAGLLEHWLGAPLGPVGAPSSQKPWGVLSGPSSFLTWHWTRGRESGPGRRESCPARPAGSWPSASFVGY